MDGAAAQWVISLCPGQEAISSSWFKAPEITEFLAPNIAGLENIANLETLPATGATLIALPMKIAGESGGPCRIVAILP